MSLLVIADHASNAVPPGVDLGIPDALMREHIAVDIGAGALAQAISARLGCSYVLGAVSRLVIDLNREEDSPGLIPAISDGYVVLGNVGLSTEERERRLATWHRPYHDGITGQIERDGHDFLVSVHSFTPALASRVEPRPWTVGILYNSDDRAARIALALLRADGIAVGDNEPYSGRDLNYTMNRHAEARGLPYLGFEVRQDELATEAVIEKWADRLARVVEATRERL